MKRKESIKTFYDDFTLKKKLLVSLYGLYENISAL